MSTWPNLADLLSGALSGNLSFTAGTRRVPRPGGTMNKWRSIALLFAVLVVPLAMATTPVSAASRSSHSFDLASICRREYLYDGTRRSDRSASEYNVYVSNPQDAYTWRCKRIYGVLAPQNRIDGIGEYRGEFGYWRIYGFDLTQACRTMAGGRPFDVRLGNSTNPYSWSCWY